MCKYVVCLCCVLLLGLVVQETQNTLDASVRYYEIEVAHNDELFIINGEKFEAKTYCFGWSKGDKVTFLEGSPNGTCTSATLYNQNRGKTCEVWCE